MRNKSGNFLIITVFIVYLLHQDIWFWDTAKPFFFGFMPVGLFYHVCFSLAAAGIMVLLVKYSWPKYLEKEIEDFECKKNSPNSKAQNSSQS